MMQQPKAKLLAILVFLSISHSVSGYLNETWSWFSYDGDTYYLPGDTATYPNPDMGTSSFSYYSSFTENGATPAVLQTCITTTGYIGGLKIIWTDNTEQGVGLFANNAPCPSGYPTKTLQLNVENGEVITAIQTFGLANSYAIKGTGFVDLGVLAYFVITTNEQVMTMSGTIEGVTWGTIPPYTDVASGIIGGFFGYASSDMVSQLGLLMLQDISSVAQSTNSFDSYPNNPDNNNIGGQPLDATGSQIELTGVLSYSQQTGYSSTYTTALSGALASTTNLAASYNYAATVPFVGSTSASASASEQFQFNMSTSATKSQTQDATTTVTESINLCCPPGYYCTWNVYQGQGSISSTNPAQTTLGTTVTFKTATTVSYTGNSPWYGSSSNAEISIVLTTNPPPSNGTEIDDVTNYCNSEKRRRSLQASSSSSKTKLKATDLDFMAVYKNPKSTQLRVIENRLSKLGVTKKNLYAHNSWLRTLKPTSFVFKGKKLTYRVKQKGFIYKFKGKA